MRCIDGGLQVSGGAEFQDCMWKYPIHAQHQDPTRAAVVEFLEEALTVVNTSDEEPLTCCLQGGRTEFSCPNRFWAAAADTPPDAQVPSSWDSGVVAMVGFGESHVGSVCDSQFDWDPR